MIITQPETEWVIDAGRYRSVVVTYRNPIALPEGMIPKLPSIKPDVKLIRPVVTVLAFEALAALSWALLAGAVIELLIVGQMQFQTPRQRRRVRTQICTKTCLSIIANARQTAFSKYSRNRALDTTELERRKARRFLSRA